MASWNELLDQFAQIPDQDKGKWVTDSIDHSLQKLSALRGDRNVLFYASSFLQKPQLNPYLLQLTYEEINGIMACLFGMQWDKGLTLILHTPGGMINAAETVVQYLTSKFDDIEVIVPTFAMSAGTMIALASDRIVLGRQSQLGPIDPQMQIGSGSISARAVVDQFERAKVEILQNVNLAHAWAPALGSLGPALLIEAQNALDYGERMVAGWLEQRMFKNNVDAAGDAKRVAHYFNDAGTHKSHGRRISRDEAKAQGLTIEDLELDQAVQDAVLTAYHLMTIAIEQTQISKVLTSSHGRRWVKNHPV